MTPSDLAAWLAHMGYNNSRAAMMLGLTGNSTVARWLSGEVPISLTTALACRALAEGLGPWDGAELQNRTALSRLEGDGPANRPIPQN